MIPKLKAAEINKALEEAGLGESINYYQDKLEYITEPNLNYMQSI